MVNQQISSANLLLLHFGLEPDAMAALTQSFICHSIDIRQWHSEDTRSDALTQLGRHLDGLSTTVILVPMAERADDMEISEAWIDTTFANLFCSVQFAAQQMMAKSAGGQLIFLQSVVGEVGHPQALNTSVLAGATIGLMKSLAKEIARYRVSVNVIALGNCPELGYRLYMDSDYENMFASTGLGASVNAEAVHHSIACLHNSAMAISGQVIRADGGLVI